MFFTQKGNGLELENIYFLNIIYKLQYILEYVLHINLTAMITLYGLQSKIF